MEILARKLDNDMHGPQDFATVSEQFLIAEGYVWAYDVFKDGLCIRTGIARVETEDELRAFIESGKSSREWEKAK